MRIDTQATCGAVVDGDERPAGDTFAVTDPSTNEPLATVANGGVDDDHEVSREELFGPVLSVYEFADEAVAPANDTSYGLYGVVWTRPLDRAHRVASELAAGSVAVNEYPATFPQAPFGGYKQSGIGREKGRQAIAEYTELKNVSVALGETPGAVFER